MVCQSAKERYGNNLAKLTTDSTVLNYVLRINDADFPAYTQELSRVS